MFNKIKKYKTFLFALFMVYFIFPGGVFAQQEAFIRITGGPIFYDELTSSRLDKKKWELWPVEYEEKKYFSYQIDSTGFTLLANMDCFDDHNFYGIVSEPIRGLTDIALVAEVEASHQTKHLPAVIHLCNCCSNFSDLDKDDFWCEIDINKDGNLHFHCAGIGKFKTIDSHVLSLANIQKSLIGAKSEKYLIKITQSHPSYKISGYIRPLNGKYELVGSTSHPYPLSQAKVELKTYSINCNEKNSLQKPSKIATFRNVRIYKNPKNNPLFIRVVGKDGIGISDYKVKFVVKGTSGKNQVVEGITEQDGYATLNISKLSIQEYPIFKSNIQLFKAGLLFPVFNEDYEIKSLSKGIYPGDFWQVYCEKCD